MANENNLHANPENMNVMLIFMITGLALAKLVFDKLKDGRHNGLLQFSLSNLELAEMCLYASLAGMTTVSGAWQLATCQNIASSDEGLGALAAAASLPFTMAAGFMLDDDDDKPDSILFASQISAAIFIGSLAARNLLVASAAITFPTALTFSYNNGRNKPTWQMFRDATTAAAVTTTAVWACSNRLS